MEIYIDIYNDDDGMFGGMGSDELEKVDTEATISKYQEMLEKRIKRSYPGAVIKFHYGPTMKDVEIHVYDDNGEPDFSEEEEVKICVQSMSDETYQNNDIWIMK